MTASWDEIRTAFQVARLGTVSGAAEALGVHHATVIRHIDALEAELGAKLFQRHARGYTPTEAGRELLDAAQDTDDRFAQLTCQFISARLAGQIGHSIGLGKDELLAAAGGIGFKLKGGAWRDGHQAQRQRAAGLGAGRQQHARGRVGDLDDVAAIVHFAHDLGAHIAPELAGQGALKVLLARVGNRRGRP